VSEARGTIRGRRRTLVALGGTAVALALAGAGCGGDGEGKGASGGGGGEKEKDAGRVAVLLPDSKSSIRWESFDRPFLKAAFDKAGVPVDIQNAEGDKSAQQQQAEQAITNGATVLLLTNLDSGSGAAIAGNAKSQNVKVIDYDRLTLNTDATDYYVSFDNEAVGRLQGEGLVKCIEEKGVDKPAIAVLNGSPTDNNATLFKKGYDSVINPKFKSGEWTEVADQSVPEWDNQKALTIFEQMLQKADNQIDGVVAANDGLANAAISAMKQRKLEPVPVTGQDATAQGIQNILNGDQCMTVYKAVRAQADAAAQLAIALAKGEQPTGADEQTDNGTKKVPSVLLEPVSVTEDNIEETVLKDKFLKRAEICAGRMAATCEKAGI
jgi:D-xylose transport system substrate-binding protein